MVLPKAIENALKNDSLVIFAGSGLSKKFDLPDWQTLVKEVITQLDNPKYAVLLPVLEMGLMTPIEVLEKIKNEHTSIRHYIKKKFNINNGDYSFHKKVIAVSDKIITTNYDNAFENAFNNKVVPAIYTSDFNISEINKNNDSYILKLHGSYSEADKCLIFKSDYDLLYSTAKSAIQKLKSIFTEKTILFLGFSFNDPEINSLFDSLDISFANHNKHYIVTKTPEDFDKYRFLETIKISDFNEIEQFIDHCIDIKENKSITIEEAEPIKTDQPISVLIKPKIAFLYPNPLDINTMDNLSKVLDCFTTLNVNLFVGTLNLKSISSIDDYDLLIIATKCFKSNVYIEEENLKSNLISPEEICRSIPNEKIPVIFITDDSLKMIEDYETINVCSLKPAIINRFIFKSLRKGEFNYIEPEIVVNLNNFFNLKIEKGIASISSLYNCNKDLDIGKKSMNGVVGRIEEQSSIALKILSIKTSNKFLNIKASGGTGKTTLIKKIAYDLYNRGHFTEGVSFKSCESIKTYADFEEILISGFNLTNILDFVDHLIENHSFQKKDILIILDNFETIVNSVSQTELTRIIDLLKFATDYANIIITSRESISLAKDFEDLYSLTPLTTDDAFALFIREYGNVADHEIKILRSDILEDLLNNNPLAIKLVTQSRTKFKHIVELKQQLSEHFFESVNDDYSKVYVDDADLNIERTRSLFQSINYSYATLSNTEKLAFELLNLFPDGISLTNFKKCFDRKRAINQINDGDLRKLRDKSLVEDYNGNLQLQPIIRRFAEHQFSKRSKEMKQKYSLDAYVFNCFILEFIEYIEIKKSSSEALKLFNIYKNNMLKVLTYIPEIPITEKGPVKNKSFFLNYIYSSSYYIATEKQINEYQEKLDKIGTFFSELPHADELISVMKLIKVYFYKEFDISYHQLTKLLSVEAMELRRFSEEEIIEQRFKSQIANIHSMEGHTLKFINAYILNNNETSRFLGHHFFYLGINYSLDEKDKDFYFFESQMAFNTLDTNDLDKYIESLHQDENLEIVQCTYTLSKVKILEKAAIQKLVVTNPYTRGLKDLMNAFWNCNNKEDKMLSRNFLHI